MNTIDFYCNTQSQLLSHDYCIAYNYTILDFNNYNFIYSIFYNIFIPIFVFSTGFLFSFIFISYCIYKPLVNDFIKSFNKNPDLYIYDSFLLEYIDQFNNLQTYKLTTNQLKKLKNSFINITTKFGKILMYYDYENQSFNYYAKQSNTFSFNYLDAVSRIYVVEYNCKNLYHDNFGNYYLKFNDDNSEINNDNNDLSNNKSSVFYTKIFKKKNKQLDFKANKYKYKGTLQYFYKKYQLFNRNITKLQQIYLFDTDTHLSNLDLSNLDLSNLDLSNLHLSNLHLSNLHSSNVDLSNVDLSNVDLSNVDLSNVDLSNVDLSNLDLSNLDLSNLDLSNLDLSNYIFSLNNNIDDIDSDDENYVIPENTKQITYSDFIKKQN